ncbi:Lrp/AsnC family transcriptional regulator [Candidatus Woesearchaeota archaeon]|nr:Lrp/AsnC family transcriptional regulator [Candidatus Woesearchaeota archaeon]
MDIDKKDLAIIRALRENSREPIRAIAKRTKLRPSTVHQRILRLKEKGIIERFTLKLNNKAMGEGFIVFMLIKTKPSAIFDKLAGDEHIKEFFGITGEYDLLLKLKFKDVEDFNNYVIRFRKEQAIQTTLTMVATANVKEEP